MGLVLCDLFVELQYHRGKENIWESKCRCDMTFCLTDFSKSVGKGASVNSSGKTCILHCNELLGKSPGVLFTYSLSYFWGSGKASMLFWFFFLKRNSLQSNLWTFSIMLKGINPESCWQSQLHPGLSSKSELPHSNKTLLTSKWNAESYKLLWAVHGML